MARTSDSRLRSKAAAVLLLAFTLTACGNIANIGKSRVLDRFEALQDPTGFERVNFDVFNEDTEARFYDRGYVLTWEPETEGQTPEQVLNAFLPVLNDVGYATETIDDTRCTANAVSYTHLTLPTKRIV